MEAEIIYDSHAPNALQRAHLYAGDDGFIASLPHLLQARVNADFDNIIWNTWFTAHSEECVVSTPQGNKAMVTVHGDGIFGTPERIKKLYHASTSRHSGTGFTGLFAGRITEAEASDLLRGKLAGGAEIPVYSFDEFKRGIANMPRRYAVVMDLETAKNAHTGYHAFDDLKDDPVMITRAGGVAAATAYLDKAKARGNSTVTGSHHRFNEMRSEWPQGCVLLLHGSRGGVAPTSEDHLRGIDSEYGLRGDTGMINLARYIAVAPRHATTGVRDLPFVA